MLMVQGRVKQNIEGIVGVQNVVASMFLVD